MPEISTPVSLGVIIGTLVICTVLYLAVCLVITGMVKYSSISEGAPIADAFDQVDLGWAKVLIGIAAIAGLSSVILVDIVAMAFAFPVALFSAMAADYARRGKSATWPPRRS